MATGQIEARQGPLKIPAANCECECDVWCNLSRANIQSTVDAIHLDFEAVVLSFGNLSHMDQPPPADFPESGTRRDAICVAPTPAFWKTKLPPP